MYDVIVIGAGPSGMMTSIVASKRGLKVLLIDKNKEVGNKLKLTGGGRCNLTNLKNTNELVNIIHNGKTLYSSLSEFGSNEICDFFKKADIELQKEDNDRIFTKSGKSIEIINALKSMLSNVKIMYETEVLDIVFSDIKEVVTTNGTFKSKKIVIAAGGKSYPKTGSTGDGYKFAKKAGHTISMLLPAETYVNTKNNFELAGLTIDVKIKYKEKQSTGSMLFTHKGLSGPSIFNLSEYIYLALLNSKEEAINIDFLPNVKMEQLSNNFKKELGSTEARIWLKKYLPTKLSEYILGDLKNIKLASISKKNIDTILNNIKNMEVTVIKTGSLEEAIVTSGGVSILEINPTTMESKKISGLYFAGEVLDLHGPMGGYNLTIAFSTGYKVGKSI